MKRFDGKAVVVTGAGSGIGAACVRRLHAEGAKVIAVDAGDAGVKRVIADLDGAEHITCVVSDVRDREACVRLIAAARQNYGALEGLINCAGIKGVGNIFDVDPQEFQNVMAVNLEGTVNMCHAYVKAVKDDPSSRAIVNVSSGAGVLGVPNRLPYVASKFGVSGITKAMSSELGALGIRVNAVAPGMTKTPFTEYMLKDAAAVERVNAAHPIGRIGEPEEIAAVIVFLLTEDASFMTGAVVAVDGGQTACL
jgi:meso-butanediol dehydrogenase/(S,S)-butanediol dehydrogenase/diacetyl reductase